jgi:L-lysine 2,3-aminomutase
MTEPLTELTEVEHVEVLRIQPGDTVVVNVPRRITLQDADRIKELVQARLAVHVPVMVLGEGITVSIARPDIP